MASGLNAHRAGAGFGAKLVASVLGLAFAFLGCEVIARVVYPAPPDPSREPQILYQAHPDVGFLHVPNQKGWLDDGLATINELGLRGALPVTPKPAESLRILAVGDSTTFGWGVDDDGTYPAHLDRRLRQEFSSRRPEVINGGVGAYDLKKEVKLLRYLAPKLRPGIVLVGLFWNDLPYEASSPDEDPQPGVVASAQAVAPVASSSKPFHIGNSPSTLNRILRRSRALYVVRQTWLKSRASTTGATNLVKWEMALLDGRETPAIDAGWRDVAATVGEIKALGDASGFAVGIVIIPIRAQVEESHPHAKYQTRVRAIAESLGCFVVDPLPLLVKQPDHGSLFIPYDRMHLSSLGNAEIAEAVLEILRGRPELAETGTR